MSFWDSSAIVPALSIQAGSSAIRELIREDSEMTVWWGTWTECAVAISRLKREGSWDEEYEERARTRLDRLAEGWVEVEPANDLRLLAMLVSKDYPLKAADAFDSLRRSAGVR